MSHHWPAKPSELWLDTTIAVPAKKGEYYCKNDHSQSGRCRWDGIKWDILIPTEGSFLLYEGGGKVRWWTILDKS